MTDNTTPVPQHDFLAAAMIPTNEQRIVRALEDISAMLRARFKPTQTSDLTPALAKGKK